MLSVSYRIKIGRVGLPKNFLLLYDLGLCPVTFILSKGTKDNKLNKQNNNKANEK
jgi:hypothetical protein